MLCDPGLVMVIRGETVLLSGLWAVVQRVTGGGWGREDAAERERLREAARRAGARIRKHLWLEDVVNEARVAIENDLGADVAYLHLVDEHGQIGMPVGHEHDWIMSRGFLETMPPEVISWIEALFRTRASMVIQDVTGPEGEQLPPPVLNAVRAAGIVSHLLTPFGGDSEMLGLIAAERFQHGRPWTQPEIDAVESIAADIGRGLHHARMYEKERHLVEELKSVDAMRTEFFTTVAHELRAPLAAIEGYAEMLGDGDGGPVTDVQSSMLEAIERSVVRLRTLIEGLFTLAKLESQAGHAVMSPVDLAGVVAGAADAIRPSAMAGEVGLTSPDVSEGLIVEGDAGQLDRALVNLLSNAVKYTPAGGHVSVTVSAEDGWAVVTTRDDGIGIPEEERERLFTRFFRASNATERHIPGTGLGLAIVHAIVTGHGGKVDLWSREGAGTAVTVRLPMAPPRQRPARLAGRAVWVRAKMAEAVQLGPAAHS